MSKNITSSFQEGLVSDRETLWKIVKVFHPDAPDSAKENFTAYLKYDWVTVKVDVRGYGTIAIGINNCNHNMSGDSIDERSYEFALEDKMVEFQAWRFVSDRFYGEKEAEAEMLRQKPKGDYESFFESFRLLPTYKKILVSAGYRYKSADEFLQYYYKNQ